MDNQQVTLLALLDFSPVFDCVDHDILLSRLQSSFGLRGITLTWIRSFLTDRSQHVLFNGSLSIEIMLLFGVPQGSVLWPFCFCCMQRRSLTSLYHSDCPSTPMLMIPSYTSAQRASIRIAHSCSPVGRMCRRAQSMDRVQQTEIERREDSANVDRNWVTASQADRHSTLSMSQQVTAVCRSCFYQLRQLKSLKSSLTREALHSLIHTFVHCWLDYCNCAGWCGQSSPSETLVCAEHSCSYYVWSAPKWPHRPTSWRSTLATCWSASSLQNGLDGLEVCSQCRSSLSQRPLHTRYCHLRSSASAIFTGSACPDCNWTTKFRS